MATNKPTREWVPLERLVRDPGLQMRAGLADGLTDPATVERYREAMADGDDFPPLEAVTDGQAVWLVDGFQRAAAIEAMGRGSAECVVYPGGYDDALLRALAANARHGLTRTTMDCRRALTTLLDTAHLLNRVLAQAADRGGVHRVLATTCGVSKSLVIKVLEERGLRVVAGKMVKKRPVAPEAAVNPPAACPEAPTPGPSDTSAPNPRTGGVESALAASTSDRELDRALAAVKTLWTACRSLLDGAWSTHLLRCAERHAVPFHPANAPDQPLMPVTPAAPLSAIAWWEPLGKVEAVLADLYALAASAPEA